MAIFDIDAINNIIRRSLEDAVQALEQGWWAAHLAVGDAATAGATGEQIKQLTKVEAEIHGALETNRRILRLWDSAH